MTRHDVDEHELHASRYRHVQSVLRRLPAPRDPLLIALARRLDAELSTWIAAETAEAAWRESLVPTSEAAQQRNLSPGAVRRALREGRIPGERVDGSWRVEPVASATNHGHERRDSTA